MSDDTNVEQRARTLGWVPQEEWRGDIERWTDAETFVKRGEEILPILKQNNKTLQSDVVRLTAEVQRLSQQDAARQEAIDALRAVHASDTKEKIQQTKREVIQHLREAKEAGNLDQELELMDRLTEINNTIKVMDATPPAQTRTVVIPPATEEPTPEFKAWMSQNDWFDKDPIRTSLAIGIAQKMRQDPANAGLVGEAFLIRVAQEVNATLNPRGGSSKVGESNGSGNLPTGGSTVSFAALPKDAKDVCLARVSKMVGPGKPFKTEADWKESFARIYLGQGATA